MAFIIDVGNLVVTKLTGSIFLMDLARAGCIVAMEKSAIHLHRIPCLFCGEIHICKSQGVSLSTPGGTSFGRKRKFKKALFAAFF
jgi:hypothetical protein